MREKGSPPRPGGVAAAAVVGQRTPATSPVPHAPPAPAALGAALPITLLMQSAASAATLAPAVAAPALLPLLRLGPAAVGVYVALVYLAAMASSLWGAGLVARWGPIRTSQFALACAAGGMALMALARVDAAVAGALLIGLGYGPITPASSQMLARTTPPGRVALVFSLKQTGVPLGGAIAGLVVPMGLATGGVAFAMGQVALLAVLSALLAQRLRAGLDDLRDAGAPLPGWAALAAPARFVLGHRVLRGVAACSFVYSVVQVSFVSYAVSLLEGDLRWTLVAAGAALSAAQAGGVVGRVLWGLVADRFGARATLIGLGAGMLAATVLTGLLQPATPAAAVVALMVVFGATAVGWNGVYLATVAKLVPREQAAAATAGTLFFTFGGVVVGPPIFGAVGGTPLGLAGAFVLLALPLAWTLVSLWRADWRT